MAWRTSEAAVRAIIETDKNLSIAPFIDTATAMTDYIVSQDADSQLNNALLEEIEKYLAAHFYRHRDAQAEQKTTEKASAVFQGKTAMYLEGSWWGQTAIALDVTGCLRGMSKGTRARIIWLGKPPSEQIDYADRD